MMYNFGHLSSKKIVGNPVYSRSRRSAQMGSGKYIVVPSVSIIGKNLMKGEDG